ncbi:MAG: hypothetical protein KC731_00690 [Myxococcales bacterium]|nr:hypothetical protein [Myxococcales bacterium]
MKPLRFTFVALASVVFASAMLSCNKDETTSETPETEAAQPQPSPATMPSSKPGHAGGMMMMDPRASCPMVVEGTEAIATMRLLHHHATIVPPSRYFCGPHQFYG